MEECVLAEASHQRGDSILTSKPNRPLVKIDSISIDLISADEKNEAEKCQHFSIRYAFNLSIRHSCSICIIFSQLSLLGQTLT